VPFSKGGLDELENYRLAHFECNQLKNDMTIEEFRVFQKGGELVE
jgi:5-methylcytosine-specific restriction endonuclease McrA